MADGIEKIWQTHQKVIEEGYTLPMGQAFDSYAISNLRGGVGKSWRTGNAGRKGWPPASVPRHV